MVLSSNHLPSSIAERCATVRGIVLVDSNFLFCLGASTESAINKARASFTGVMTIGLDKSSVGGTDGLLHSKGMGGTEGLLHSKGKGGTKGLLL